MRASFHRCSPAGTGSLSLWLLVALAGCLCISGCVRRRMMIRSNPPGARVYVDDYEIGTTPVSHNFIYYGQRKIRLVKDGYETLTLMQSIPAPWYQIPPLDFVTENLVPGEIRDQRTFHYQLVPQRVVPTEELLGRAENLRHGVRSAGGIGPSPVGPPVRVSPTPMGPEILPTPTGTQPIPTGPGVGGQPLYPLPPGAR